MRVLVRYFVRLIFAVSVLFFIYGSDLFSQELKLVVTVEPLVGESYIFYIDEVNLLDNTGNTIVLSSSRKKIDSQKGPVILVDSKVPTGNYRELVIKVWENYREKTYRFSLEGRERDSLLWFPLYLRKTKSGELELLYQRPLSFVKENVLFIPMRDSELIGVYDRVNYRLMDLYYIPSGVDELSRSYKFDYLYGVSQKKNALHIIDLVKNKSFFVELKRGVSPVSIASTILNNGKELIFIANFRSNTITVVDGETLGEVRTLRVGQGPIRVWVDPPPEWLKVKDQEIYNYLMQYRNVYCLNLYSGSMTVFKLDAQRGEILSEREVSLGSKPIGLFVDYEKGLIYIMNQNANYIHVGFIISLTESPLSVFKIETGEFGVVDGVYHPRIDQMILLKETPGELIFGKLPLTGTQYFNQFLLLTKLSLKGEPSSLTLDPDLSKLYVLDSRNNQLLIYDFYTKKILSELSLFKNPGRIVIW